jgi:hypothetical protein
VGASIDANQRARRGEGQGIERGLSRVSAKLEERPGVFAGVLSSFLTQS